MSSLIYIHGFNSSPESTKAKILTESLAALGMNITRFMVPDLNHDPELAMSSLADLIETAQAQGEQVYLIGSSLGGFYATYLAEQYGLKAVLINPAIKPYELLKDYLGLNKNIYTGQEYQVTEAHMDQLKRFDIDVVDRPENYLLLVQTNDEVLDYTQATNKFWQSPSVIEYGGNHSFEAFQSKLALIGQFFKTSYREAI